MNKLYELNRFNYIYIVIISLFMASCHKPDNPTPTNDSKPVKIGLYEVNDGLGSDYQTYSYYHSDIPITTIGNQNVNYKIIFDTGSGGLVIDASGILPASLITDNGFNFTGDSTVVNGITITNQTAVIKYGPTDATSDKVYGNLAYAQVTIGDNNGSVVVKRLPFLLYYKAISHYNPGQDAPAHSFDIFGSAEVYDYVFSNNVNLTTPFSFCTPGTGLIKGYKMAAESESSFSTIGDGNYVPGALTFGLTSSDLSSSSGFVLHPINFISQLGYFPLINGTVTYNGSTFSTHLLFDSGTNFGGLIEDPKYTGSGDSQLSPNTSLSMNTNNGFNYKYTVTGSTNLSFVAQPENGFSESIMGIEYFFNNEYLLDLTNHQVGLKNN